MSKTDDDENLLSGEQLQGLMDWLMGKENPVCWCFMCIRYRLPDNWPELIEDG